MTPPTVAERRPELVTRGVPAGRPGWIEAATSLDHKAVAKLYLGTSLTMLAVAALEFALVRAQLIVPDNTLLEPEIFARILSASLVTTVVLFAVPFLLGLIGYIVPLQIGARGVALPRLNQLSYWLYAVGAFMVYASFMYTVPETGLAPFPPLGDDVFSPAHGADAWIGGVGLATLGFVCCAINLVATVTNMRAPGMAWRRTPIFTWAATAIGWLLLVIGPVMLAALVMLTIDRHFDGIFFDAGEGGEPLLFSHLAWIFFTGCHAIVVIGAAGVISEIVPTFARKPLFSHRAAGVSVVAIAALSFFAWMQNMYSAPIAEGFGYMAMAAAVALLIPVGVLVFTWVATMWEGSISLRMPMAFALWAIVLMVLALGGELMTSVIPVGLQLENTTAAQQDTIVLYIGAVVLGGFAALHYWLPKISGRLVNEGLAKLALLKILAGTTLYATAMFLAGLEGQPVDVYRFYDGDDLGAYNLIASLGAFAIAAGVLLELANLARSYTSGRPAGHDPWGGSTLEWFALSPPPPHNFDAVPDVRSDEPLRDIRQAVREGQAAYTPPPAAPAVEAPAEPVAEPVAEPEAPAQPEPPAEPDDGSPVA